MVSAINFAVRNSAGGTQLGSVGGEGQSNLIAVQPGQNISLNLSPGSVVAYKQQGSDLIVQLSDGRSVVLSNYFAGAGSSPAKLYLSSNDEIVEVRVADGVDGVLFADYGPMQAMEKWSPLDDLRFSESDVLSDALLASNEPAGMAALVPGLLAGGGTAAGIGGLGTAAALAGGAVLLGGVGGGGGGTGGGTTGGGTTGGGTTGGGTTGGGTGGGGTVSNTVNMTSVAGDGTINFVESQGGFTVNGSGVAGATVAVTIAGATQTVTVGSNGQWSANFGGGVVTQNGTTTMTVTSTVTGGGTVTQTHQINVDTVATASFNASQSHGASINAMEAAAGVSIAGRADANSSVIVNFEGQTVRVVADANGNWTANFSLSHLVGAGAVERSSTATVTATDPYGNVAQSSQTIAIDTLAPNDPLFLQDVGTVGIMSGVITAAAPGDYTYHAVGAVGAAQQLVVSPSTTWMHTREDGTSVASETVQFATNVPNGSYLVIRDVDAAGNESSTLHLRSTTEVTVDLSRAGLQGFDFGTINLLSADANLTLNTAQVLALTGADKQMTVTGNSDDAVTLVGATATTTTVNSNGETYKLYTLGSGASVLVDDDIGTINLIP